MTDSATIISTAILQNNLLKESFLTYTNTYFGKSCIQSDVSLERTPWACLFREYVELSKKYPENARQPIDKVIESLDVDSMWNESLLDLHRQAHDFIISSRYFADEIRPEYLAKDLSIHVFERARENGNLACYMENYRIPNHANIVIQTKNQEAADMLPDMLWRAGADLGTPRKTFAIKLVDKSVLPREYMTRMIRTSCVPIR
ncbi:MAG: hypothetical protein LBJ73_01450 [Rickettsiales bacterium]|jgi:hypothetical protein|nr:hypothetical protein [Rickettsiales bacterium]